MFFFFSSQVPKKNFDQSPVDQVISAADAEWREPAGRNRHCIPAPRRQRISINLEASQGSTFNITSSQRREV